ncbi:hypothetical protein GOBAR_DD00879 [Gossypium barbadense]|nr:hypothetical protein GOBAR_DD00879 [Gossypium barbadense]
MRQCVEWHIHGLPYPHLITEMCMRAGAAIDPEEPTCPPKGPSTSRGDAMRFVLVKRDGSTNEFKDDHFTNI